MRAKTGRLNKVVSLTGLARIGEARQAVFSILVNDYACPTWKAQDAVDGIVRAITAEIVLDWRRLFREKIENINRVYSPNIKVSSDDLADMLSAVMEGGIMLSRALDDPTILEKQLLEYRSYIELLYRSPT